MFKNSPKIRRLQLEQQADDNTIRQLIGSSLNTLAVSAEPGAVAGLPPIIQMLRNTDGSHSVESWWHTTPTAGDQNYEAAGIYTHEKPNPKVVTDGAMSSTVNPNTLTCSPSAPFVAGDVGAKIIVEGAGASGGKLVTTISGFTSASVVGKRTNNSSQYAFAFRF